MAKDGILTRYEGMSHVTSCFSREIFLTAENMADEHARKWDRCLADTAVKTG